MAENVVQQVREVHFDFTLELPPEEAEELLNRIITILEEYEIDPTSVGYHFHDVSDDPEYDDNGGAE